jgi:hypothetical protein
VIFLIITWIFEHLFKYSIEVVNDFNKFLEINRIYRNAGGNAHQGIWIYIELSTLIIIGIATLVFSPLIVLSFIYKADYIAHNRTINNGKKVFYYLILLVMVFVSILIALEILG